MAIFNCYVSSPEGIVDFLLFFFLLVVAVSGAQAAAMASILGLEAFGTATGSVYLSSFMSHRY